MKNCQAAQIGDRAAGSNTIDPHMRPDFYGELPDQPDNRVLRGGVKSAAAPGVQSRDRRRKHHRALCLEQLRQGRLRTKEASLDVDPEQLVKGIGKLLLRKLGKRRVNVEDPGIADKDVEMAKDADGFGNRAFVVGELGHVAGAGDDGIAKFRRQLSGSLRDAVEHPDPRTLFDKARHHRPADPDPPPVTRAT